LWEAGVDDPGTIGLRTDLAASMLAVRGKFLSFANVLGIFDQAGVEALVLKGVGIAPLAYPDPGTRPVSDLDVIVRPEQVSALDDLVQRGGGYRKFRAADPAVRARYRHAAPARIDGHDVDIHWRLLTDRFDRRPDEALFDRARDVRVGPARARTLSVEDHVVHAIAHGVRCNRVAPVRWIADVARLVESHPVDWSIVEEQAVLRRIEAVVGRGLTFVSRRYGVPVPEATLKALRLASGLTRGRPDLWSRSPKRTRVGRAVSAGVVDYVLASRGWPRRQRVVRYPEYVRFRLVGPGKAVDDLPHARWHG
jgi:hypothetical protein